MAALAYASPCQHGRAGLRSWVAFIVIVVVCCCRGGRQGCGWSGSRSSFPKYSRDSRVGFMLVIDPLVKAPPQFVFCGRLGTAIPKRQMSQCLLKARPRQASPSVHFTGAAIFSDDISRFHAPVRILMHAEGETLTKSPWELLGLPESATQAEIKSQYRKLVAKEHPDKNPDDPQAADRFVDIVAAYEQLTEPQKESASAVNDADEDLDESPLSEEMKSATKVVAESLRNLVTVLFALGLLTQPLGFWADSEIKGKCITGNIDTESCEQLVQLRCVGEFAFGDVQQCQKDGRYLVSVTSTDALYDRENPPSPK
ncbi:unnamed protein product [Polarella glacialis]|uniref:J domain-containing protein n=1 Tax=Polarella glacialis TaxID=89957 RepID=A0A813K9C7_POLGL|nr:unnamed protein product [Polarella glacialis]